MARSHQPLSMLPPPRINAPPLSYGQPPTRTLTFTEDSAVRLEYRRPEWCPVAGRVYSRLRTR